MLNDDSGLRRGITSVRLDGEYICIRAFNARLYSWEKKAAIVIICTIQILANDKCNYLVEYTAHLTTDRQMETSQIHTRAEIGYESSSYSLVRVGTCTQQMSMCSALFFVDDTSLSKEIVSDVHQWRE